jgi:hypothetical protein
MSTTPSRKGIGGPKTPEGKKRSSMNALRPRRCGYPPSLDEKVGVPFAETLEQMRAYYRPADPVEEELVRRIARCTQRLKITEVMEHTSTGKSYGYSCPDQPYVEIMKFERLVDIHLHRAIRTLLLKREADEKVLKRTRAQAQPTLKTSAENELI